MTDTFEPEVRNESQQDVRDYDPPNQVQQTVPGGSAYNGVPQWTEAEGVLDHEPIGVSTTKARPGQNLHGRTTGPGFVGNRKVPDEE